MEVFLHIKHTSHLLARRMIQVICQDTVNKDSDWAFPW